MFAHYFGLGERRGGNRLYWRGHRLNGGIVGGIVEEGITPISPHYSYYYGSQKIYVTNGPFPFGSINYYF
ncbi:MAG: hypothetical protein ACI35P_14760 [Bacillus sp. (in: firmicutes)]